MRGNGRPGERGRIRFEGRLFALIIGLGLGLRLVGIGFCLPHAVHPDENSILDIAWRVATEDPNPHWFFWPTGWIDINAVFIAIYYWGGRLLGLSAGTLWRGFHYHPEYPHYFVRGLSMVISTLTLIPVRRLGSKLGGSAGSGLLAAALLAVMPTAVRLGHYGSDSTALAFFLLLAVEALSEVPGAERKDSRRIARRAGACLGVALSIKWGAAVMIPAGILALSLRPRGERMGSLISFSTSSVAAFTILSPFAVLDLRTSLGGLLSRLMMLSRPSGALDASTVAVSSPGFVRKLQVYSAALGGELGILGIVFLVIGAGHLLLSRRRREGLPLLFWMISFAGALLFAGTMVPRFLMPILPPAAAVAGAGAASILRRARGWKGGIAALALIQPLTASVSADIIMARPDTRDMATLWIIRNIPEGARIGTDLWHHSPYIPRERYERLQWLALALHPLDYYLEKDYDYLVLSENTEHNYMRDNAADTGFYEALRSWRRPVAVFEGERLTSVHNPRIEIYSLKATTITPLPALPGGG